MSIREVIVIDEEKCDGCELCVPACAEGAIQIINGKAKLISDTYCDGLGACLGECPQDAIKMVKREAEDYDVESVEKHLAKMEKKDEPAPEAVPTPQKFAACPGSMSRSLPGQRPAAPGPVGNAPSGWMSGLRNWPIQLMLVPPQAPYYDNADLLIAADCVPFAFADFDRQLLAGRTLIIACPKLDNVEFYIQKLTEIFKSNNIKSVEVAYMEVPCCFGLVHLIQTALEKAGVDIPLYQVRLGIQGQLLERTELRKTG
jgi:Pyruvate/2-oxoacid:ferredoxin oxidoreductase delta subunit